MRSNVFQLPEDIIHHLHFESRDREKCENSRMFCSVCTKRGRKISKIDGERSRRPPGTHIWWVYKHKRTLLFMALWLVVTSNGSTEIILSSYFFMHSQTQSQPQRKVVILAIFIPRHQLWVRYSWFIQQISTRKTVIRIKLLKRSKVYYNSNRIHFF